MNKMKEFGVRMFYALNLISGNAHCIWLLSTVSILLIVISSFSSTPNLLSLGRLEILRNSYILDHNLKKQKFSDLLLFISICSF